MTPTEELTRHVIGRCDHALVSRNPQHLTAAIMYGIAWLRELRLFPDSESIADRRAVRLGEILGDWYGTLSDEREEAPSIMRLEELTRLVRSDHDDILALERGETGAE